MRFTKSIAVLFSVIFAISSCNNISDGKSNDSTSMLFTSGGRTSEVLVVMSDQNWESVVGDTIRKTLGEVPPFLAKAEPEYILAQINKQQFGTVYQKFRNILIVEIKPSISKTKITVKHSVWAKPQTIIKIQSPNVATYLDSYTKTFTQIMEFYHKNELLRIADTYKRMEVKSITKELKNQFSIKLIIPKGFGVATSSADFMWLRKETPDIEEGIMIYSYPYSDTSLLSYQSVIKVRDSITRRYIPGPVDGSYMKGSSYFPPAVSNKNFKGNYATLVRGLWDTKGYPLGGPFLNYTFVDTIANRVITLDGYIQAPRKDKRDLLLHLEAIFSTFEFVNSAPNPEN